MFSKEESKRIRQEFWTSFGKSFPRKWILYNTKIKDLSFKFHFDRKLAKVSVDIEDPDPEWRQYYFEKWEGLKAVMQEEIEGLQFALDYELENGKKIATIYTELKNVSIHDKSTWQETMYFLKENMVKIESFWIEYKDFIKS